MVQEPESVAALVHRIHEIIQDHEPGNDSLLNGRLGMVLYYHSLWMVCHQDAYLQTAYRLLEKVFDNMNSNAPGLAGASLGSGVAGLAGVVSLLHKGGWLDMDIREELAELDTYLYSSALRHIEAQHPDYLHGAFGIIRYFADRLPDTTLKGYLENMVNALCDTCVTTTQGVWFRNYVVDKKEAERVNFSLSHGQCGFLIVLSELYQAGILQDKTGFLLKEGIRFIKAHLQPVDFLANRFSCFPLSIGEDGGGIYANRLAWCYGDLNEVLLFYKAAFVLEDEELKQMADLIGSSSIIRRTAEATLCTDSHFCHGAAGLAVLYRSLYRHSGLDKYQEAHRYWINRTVALLEADTRNGLYTGKEHNLLEGLPGVALALLGSISTEDLPWCHLLLL